MKNKDEILTIVEIAKRAERMELLMFERMSLIMDLEHTHEQFKLRLDDLLNADDFNFTHDIVGIQNHFNRQRLEMEDLFVPRYATQ